MAGIKGNKSHASSTSFPNQKNWDKRKHPSIVLRKFNEMIQNTINDDQILCWQDACLSIGWRCSKVEYWCGKIPLFEKLKTDIQQIIISRINNGSLVGKFQPTASIWRMKMLGESETQHVDMKGDMNLNITPIQWFSNNTNDQDT